MLYFYNVLELWDYNSTLPLKFRCDLVTDWMTLDLCGGSNCHEGDLLPLKAVSSNILFLQVERPAFSFALFPSTTSNHARQSP